MIKGERVILRPMKPEDITRQHEFEQDLELYGLDSDYPHVASLEHTQAFYEERTKPNKNTAPFAIETDGKYIGFCTLMNIKDRNGNLELGVMIGDREYWNKEYGRETVRLLLNYGFYYFGARRIALTTHAKNERAIRCYKACGFVEEGRPRKVLWIEGEYTDLVNMSILHDEWQTIGDSSLAE